MKKLFKLISFSFIFSLATSTSASNFNITGNLIKLKDLSLDIGAVYDLTTNVSIEGKVDLSLYPIYNSFSTRSPYILNNLEFGARYYFEDNQEGFFVHSDLCIDISKASVRKNGTEVADLVDRGVMFASMPFNFTELLNMPKDDVKSHKFDRALANIGYDILGSFGVDFGKFLSFQGTPDAEVKKASNSIHTPNVWEISMKIGMGHRFRPFENLDLYVSNKIFIDFNLLMFFTDTQDIDLKKIDIEPEKGGGKVPEETVRQVKQNILSFLEASRADKSYYDNQLLKAVKYELLNIEYRF